MHWLGLGGIGIAIITLKWPCDYCEYCYSVLTPVHRKCNFYNQKNPVFNGFKQQKLLSELQC